MAKVPTELNVAGQQRNHHTQLLMAEKNLNDPLLERRNEGMA